MLSELFCELWVEILLDPKGSDGEACIVDFLGSYEEVDEVAPRIGEKSIIAGLNCSAGGPIGTM